MTLAFLKPCARRYINRLEQTQIQELNKKKQNKKKTKVS
jgi:hypothetical protein